MLGGKMLQELLATLRPGKHRTCELEGLLRAPSSLAGACWGQVWWWRGWPGLWLGAHQGYGSEFASAQAQSSLVRWLRAPWCDGLEFSGAWRWLVPGLSAHQCSGSELPISPVPLWLQRGRGDPGGTGTGGTGFAGDVKEWIGKKSCRVWC